MRNFAFSQWKKTELNLYKGQQFFTKEDHHFVPTKIQVIGMKIEELL